MTPLHLNTILEQLNTLVVTINRFGNIEYISPSVKTLLGYEPQSLLGERWLNVTRQEDQIANKTELLSVLRSRKYGSGPLSFERALTDSVGRTKWILWNVSLSPDNNLIGVGQDITFRKKAELELRAKNKELQLKNSEVTDSIRYAKRIQDAVIKDPGALKNYFTDAFVLYKPRDIVSGDFYWYHKKDNKVFVAAVDCTGHGVPGAIMSVIANNLLKEVVVKRGLEDAGEILHAIDKELGITLSREDGIINDGMDIALTVFDFGNNTLSFAGAHRPLLLIRNEEIKEYKGSKYPIGFFEGDKTFETHHISFQSEDRFFMLTDGYIDQFGGENDKKFNRKQFYELLTTSQHMSMDEQRSFLEYAHTNWKQDKPQTDDILVMGVRI